MRTQTEIDRMEAQNAFYSMFMCKWLFAPFPLLCDFPSSKNSNDYICTKLRYPATYFYSLKNWMVKLSAVGEAFLAVSTQAVMLLVPGTIMYV